MSERKKLKMISSTTATSPVPPAALAVPDSELRTVAKRRQFTAAYKLSVLEEADRCTEPGAMGALLRREGRYSSHLTTWRREREAGALAALGRRRVLQAAYAAHPERFKGRPPTPPTLPDIVGITLPSPKPTETTNDLTATPALHTNFSTKVSQSH